MALEGVLTKEFVFAEFKKLKTNAEKEKFELQPIYGIADFRKAFVCPNHSVAVMFQNWINKNDQFLARHNLEVSPAAKYR